MITESVWLTNQARFRNPWWIVLDSLFHGGTATKHVCFPDWVLIASAHFTPVLPQILIRLIFPCFAHPFQRKILRYPSPQAKGYQGQILRLHRGMPLPAMGEGSLSLWSYEKHGGIHGHGPSHLMIHPSNTFTLWCHQTWLAGKNGP